MTTKHHEGFCHFDTKLTDYCAPKQGPGRDLVREYVEAARAEGLRVGFYYSLMDWHHPDGARCATDEAARRRFVDYIHGQIRELMTNYGKIDILWYDVAWPLDAEGWESEKMNQMVFSCSPTSSSTTATGWPAISPLPSSGSRPRTRRLGILHDHERQLGLSQGRRQLEVAEDHRPQPGHLRARRRQLSAEYRPEARRVHPAGVGRDPDRGGQVDGEERRDDLRGRALPAAAFRCCRLHAQGQHALHARALLAAARRWRWEACRTRCKSASLLATGKPVKFEQEEFRVRFTGLPADAPDDPVTTIAIECDGEPAAGHRFRPQRAAPGKRRIKARETDRRTPIRILCYPANSRFETRTPPPARAR